MQIALHNLATALCNLLTGIRIARETGYAGIEIGGPKLKSYLSQGFSLDTLLPLLRDVPPVGLSYVQDVERQEPAQYDRLLREQEETCSLAAKLGCPIVQLLPGRLDPTGPYKGLAGKPWPEMRKLSAKNLRALAEIGRADDVKFYLEALTFTQLN